MKKQSYREVLALFLTMLKIGLFTFGGGYAMIALLENEFVSKKGWLERQEFLDLAAIAESTPGPIAINAATYIGYKQCGFWGSFAATLGVCIPSFVIIYAISLFFDAFMALHLVQCAFRGIQVCVVYLILSAGIKLLKALKRSAWNVTIVLVTMVLMLTCSLLAIHFSTIAYILACGVLGLAAYLIGHIRKGGRA